MKALTQAAEHEQGVELMMEHFRERLVLGLQTMTDGMPAIYRRNARKVLRFFSEETDAQVWARLALVPDPDNPMQSIADTWLQQWQRLGNAVGERDASAV